MAAITPIYGDIVGVKKHLEFVLQDRRMSETGVEIGLFFDTADVRRALLGMQNYIEETGATRVNVDEFRKPYVIADCLLAGGLLGPFRMLPPHQAELLRQLDRSSAFSEPKPLRLNVDEFLAELGFDSDKPGSVSKLSNKDMERFVRAQTERSVEFFKAFECIRFRWWERLKQWQTDSILNTSALAIDYLDLVKKDEFPRLLEEFRQFRKRRTKAILSHNNFTDAVSLMMMLELAQKFSSGKSNFLPRFFDPSGSFELVARKAGVLADLSINRPQSFHTSVLVGPEYLVYKATFANPSKRQGSTESIIPEDIYDAIDSTLKDQDKTWINAVHTKKVSGHRLDIVISDLVNFSFFRNVWLRETAGIQLKDLSERLNSAADLETPRFKNTYKTIFKRARKDLEPSAREYRRLGSQWIEMDRGLRVLRSNIFERKDSRPLHVVRDLSLVRFGLSPRAEDRVSELLDDLLDQQLSEDGLSSQQSWHELTRSYFEGQDDPKHGCVAGAVLWAMGAYESIIELLGPHVGFDADVSINSLFSASCFSCGEEIARGENAMNHIIQKYNDFPKRSRKYLPRAEAAIAIAYLHYHLAIVKGHTVPWGAERSVWTPLKDLELAARMLSGAVSFSREAVALLQKYKRILRKEAPLRISLKEAYALNQLLFYLVERGEEADTDEMYQIAADLPNIRMRTPAAWQPTFDDTLARLWHFFAMRTAKSEKKWTSLIDRAMSLSKRALDGDPRDKLIVSFNHQIELDSIRGYKKSIKQRSQ